VTGRWLSGHRDFFVPDFATVGALLADTDGEMDWSSSRSRAENSEALERAQNMHQAGGLNRVW